MRISSSATIIRRNHNSISPCKRTTQYIKHTTLFNIEIFLQHAEKNCFNDYFQFKVILIKNFSNKKKHIFVDWNCWGDNFSTFPFKVSYFMFTLNVMMICFSCQSRNVISFNFILFKEITELMVNELTKTFRESCWMGSCST